MTSSTIQESFQRAIHSIVGSLFSGVSRTINGTATNFPDAKFCYDIRFLQESQDDPKPRVVYSGNRISKISLPASNFGPDGRPLYEVRASVEKSVFVRTLYKGVSNEKLVADRLYGLLWLATQVNSPSLADEGIFRVEMSPVPDEIPDKTCCILRGILKCEVRSEYYHE